MMVAGPVFTTLMSAWVVTPVLTVEVLLPGVGAEVVVVMLAVFGMVEALAWLLSACSMTVKVAVAPEAREAMVSLMLPPGADRVNAGPVFCVWDTKVVPAGA